MLRAAFASLLIGCGPGVAEAPEAHPVEPESSVGREAVGCPASPHVGVVLQRESLWLWQRGIWHEGAGPNDGLGEREARTFEHGSLGELFRTYDPSPRTLWVLPPPGGEACRMTAGRYRHVRHGPHVIVQRVLEGGCTLEPGRVEGLDGGYHVALVQEASPRRCALSPAASLEPLGLRGPCEDGERVSLFLGGSRTDLQLGARSPRLPLYGALGDDGGVRAFVFADHEQTTVHATSGERLAGGGWYRLAPDRPRPPLTPCP